MSARRVFFTLATVVAVAGAGAYVFRDRLPAGLGVTVVPAS